MILTTDNNPILVRAERLMLLDGYEATRRSVQRAFERSSNISLLHAIIGSRKRIAVILDGLADETDAENRTVHKQRLSVCLAEHDVSLGQLRSNLAASNDNKPVDIEVPDWIML